MEIKRINRAQIIEELKQNGYEGKSITIEELRGLYKKYGQGMSEIDFVQTILGVSYSNYMSCKNRGTKVKVLKKEKIKLSKDEKEEIIKKLKAEGYEGKSISYGELQELHKKYGKEMLEADFAQIIFGVSHSNYLNCKHMKSKIKFLIELSEDEIQEIIEKLKAEGYEGKVITYSEFQELYKQYGKGMSEEKFAQTILKISYYNYKKCKYNNKGVIVLKGEEINLSKEEKEKIIEKLKAEGYEGKSITYEELKELYKKYGNGISEKEFVQIILGVSHSNYLTCKNKGRKVKILKSKKIELSEDEIQEIIEKLKAEGYEEKLITYSEFQELHKQYGKGMSEEKFAQTILKISYYNYKNCKYKRSRVKILKREHTELLEEREQEIIKELKEKGYVGRSIKYEELQELYKEYGSGMSEIEFVQKILGVEYANYSNCKYRGARIIIKDGIVYEKIKEIKELYLKKPDYYSEEFINNICREYNISIEEFITYIVMKGFFDVSQYMNLLKEKNRIWIGKIRLSEKFINDNIDLIQKAAVSIVNSLCNKYRGIVEREDYKQSVIMYIIENMGEAEKNFADNLEIFKKIVFGKSRKYCEYIIIQELKISSKCQGFTRLVRRGKNDQEVQIDIPDESVNVENEVIEKEIREKEVVDEMDKCIKLLSSYIEFGHEKKEAIAMTAKKMKIDSKTMLEYMKRYLLTKGRVKIRRQGEVEFVDRC